MKLNTWKKEVYDLALLDEVFLTNLLEQKDREIYARIASLDFNEQPIEYIEGRVSDGSINIDGSSAVRRTCNLTMQVADVDILDVYWGIKTKFKLDIGVKNNLSNEYQSSETNLYPDIVWFPQGTYIITSFNTAISTKGYTISLSGKDKMVMLNGEMGGELFASIDFGKEEVIENRFNLITAQIESSDILTGRTLYYKYDTIETIPNSTPIWSGDSDHFVLDSNLLYKFVVSAAGTWVKLENRYYRIADLDYHLSNGIYEKILSYPLTGITFIPLSNINYIFYDENDNIVSGAALTDLFSHFPANVNTEHTGILIYTDDQVALYKVKYKVEFKSKLYDCYKLIETPTEIFTPVTFTAEVSYKPNKYYYLTDSFMGNETSTKFYKLNTSSHSQDNNNYLIRPIYEFDTSVTLTKMTLQNIIKNLLSTYAKEPLYNIVINDLDTYGLEQLTYKGDKKLYALRETLTDDFTQLAFEGTNATIDNDVNNPNFIPDNLASGLTNNQGTRVVYNGIEYTIAVFDYGLDIGYRITDLTYAGDLITNIGDTISSVLDKLVTMLGEFEYFYDLDGRFIFLKKPTYVNTAWSLLKSNEDENFVEYFNSEHKKFAYNFEGNRLLTAFNNNPVLTNLRNDYSVWGKRKTPAGAEIPIHARYAIDKKPKEYLAFNGILYFTDEAEQDPSPENADKIYNAQPITGNEEEFHRYDIIPDILKSVDPETGKITSDWWELSDWAEYYKSLTGVYPLQYLKDYGTEGFIGNLTFSNYSLTFTGNGQLIIDFDKDSIIPGSTAPTNPLYTWRHTYLDNNGNTQTMTGWWSPFLHRFNGCWHWYSLYLDFYNSYDNMITFIYKPQIPSEEIIALDGGTLRIVADDILKVDWRELIYRMAIDYFAGLGCSEASPIYDRLGRLVINNPEHFLAAVAERNPYYFPTGYTGYELYYTDMQGFWRLLYNPDYVPKEIYTSGTYNYISAKLENSVQWKKQKIWSEKSLTDYEIEYYTDSRNVKVYELYLNLISIVNLFTPGTKEREALNKILAKYEKYYCNYNDNNDIHKSRIGWNINVFEAPDKLNFWLEFLDDTNELAECAVPAIGNRAKVINDDKVTAIYYKDIPNFIICPNKVRYSETQGNTTLEGWKCDVSDLYELITKENGYTFLFCPTGLARLFDISYRSKSAKEKIDELLYQYSYCIENVTITGLPVYHLLPNTRIYVRDEVTRINGEYIINKITLPLSINNTMSISAVKAPERFY